MTLSIASMALGVAVGPALMGVATGAAIHGLDDGPHVLAEGHTTPKTTQ